MKTASNNSRHRSESPVEVVMHDIAAIKQDVASLINGHVGAVGERARETLAKAGESAKAVASGTRRRATEMHEGLREVASARPVTTIAVAAAAGIIGYTMLGWWRRR